MKAEDQARYGAIIAAARACYDNVHCRPEAYRAGKERMLRRVRQRNRQRRTRRLAMAFAVVLGLAVVLAVAG